MSRYGNYPNPDVCRNGAHEICKKIGCKYACDIINPNKYENMENADNVIELKFDTAAFDEERKKCMRGLWKSYYKRFIIVGLICAAIGFVVGKYCL